MSKQNIYKQELLDHFHNPRNKGDLGDMEIIRRGSNPRCGDEIEVGIKCENDLVKSVRFRGRGCSICLASASIMSECASGMNLPQLRQLIAAMHLWFSHSSTSEPPTEAVTALGVVRQHPARQKCVLLAWQALEESLDGIALITRGKRQCTKQP